LARNRNVDKTHQPQRRWDALAKPEYDRIPAFNATPRPAAAP
jgi:hypothetical protein